MMDWFCVGVHAGQVAASALSMAQLVGTVPRYKLAGFSWSHNRSSRQAADL